MREKRERNERAMREKCERSAREMRDNSENREISERQVRDKGVTETRNVRISSVKRAWGNLLKEADVEPIQLRDLRTFFNWMLVSQYGLSHKEAGAYLGNSEAVNYNHYTPVSLETIGAKLRGLGDKKIISQLVA